MPLYIESYSNYNQDYPMCGVYQFFGDHRRGWTHFWEEMKGDQDKILTWAKDANVENPAEWYTSLYVFLFGHFSGDPELLKRTAKSKSFSDFVVQVAENHVSDPQPGQFYVNIGMLHKEYISCLQRAAEVTQPENIISFINARSVNLGSWLYDEYLLSLTEWKAEAEEIASDLNKQAHNLEAEVFRKAFRVKQIVRHALHPKKKLIIVGVLKNEGILAKHENGAISFIPDVWNLERTAEQIDMGTVLMDAETTYNQISTGVKMSLGARDFVSGQTYLMFRMGPAKPLTKIIITLSEMDTYTVKKVTIHPQEAKLIKEISDVYAEDLDKVLLSMEESD